MISRLLWILLVVAAAGILSLLLFVFWSGSGLITGTEISPHSFQIREFQYWHPWGLSKGLGKRETVRDEFAVALGLTGTMPAQPAGRWDLVSDNRSGPWNRDLEARFLATLLQRRAPSGDFYWVEWSSANVESAKRFWPLVSRLAVDRLYLLIPDLFAFADNQHESSAEEFEAGLITIVRRQLLDMRADAAAGSVDAEVQRLDQALLDYVPNVGVE